MANEFITEGQNGKFLLLNQRVGLFPSGMLDSRPLIFVLCVAQVQHRYRSMVTFAVFRIVLTRHQARGSHLSSVATCDGIYRELCAVFTIRGKVEFCIAILKYQVATTFAVKLFDYEFYDALNCVNTDQTFAIQKPEYCMSRLVAG